MSKRVDVEKVVHSAQMVVRSLDAILEILQKLQRNLPVPSLEEVAEIRQRKRPLTQEAFLHGLLHRCLLALENLASDLREVDLEMLRSVHKLELSGIELKAIEQAVFERRKSS
jgi:hypothetical protein